MQVIGINTTALPCAFSNKEWGLSGRDLPMRKATLLWIRRAVLQLGIRATPNMAGPRPGSDLAASDHRVVQQRERVVSRPLSAIVRSCASG
jgi:hypothetical protein